LIQLNGASKELGAAAFIFCHPYTVHVHQTQIAATLRVAHIANSLINLDRTARIVLYPASDRVHETQMITADCIARVAGFLKELEGVAIILRCSAAILV
jgi:hypothetical protein